MKKNIGYTPQKWNGHNCEFIVFQHIRSGGYPAQLWNKGILTRRQVDYALSKLKREGFVVKLGFALWKTTAEKLPERTHKKVRKIHHVASNTPIELTRAKSDTVRAHGITATVKIPRIDGWSRREGILEGLGIKFKKIPQGLSISFMDIKKVWLCNNSIVFYLPYHWLAETAVQAKRQAIYDLITIIKKLEAYLKVGDNGFRKHKGFMIKFSRQHYSLVKNALAMQYDKEKDKLFVYDEKGLWFIIDNSYHLHEAETLHPKTAVPDNLKMQNFFNGVKRTGITPEFILESLGKLTESQVKIIDEQRVYREDILEYGKKIATHTKVMESLDRGIKEFTNLIKRRLERKRKSSHIITHRRNL